MADRLARLFNRLPALPPAVEAALAQLAQLAATHADLQAATSLHTALLRVLYGAPAPVTPLVLREAEARDRLAAGMPLLRNAPLPCAAAPVRELFRRLCAAASDSARDDAAAYTALARAVRRGQLDPWELGNTLLAGAADHLPGSLTERGYPADRVMTLLRLTLLPFLEQTAAACAAWVTPQRWSQGYCPLCGAWPLLAEQRGLEQERYLRCGLCASAWTLERLRCAFCTTREPGQLGYLVVEGEEARQRVATCNACGGYLKLRSTLTPLRTPELLVEEVALVHLDVLAMGQGYVAPG